MKIFPNFFRYLDSVVGCIAELFTPLLIRPSVPVHTIGHICHPNPNRTSPQPNTHHVTRSFSKHIIPKYVPSLITHVCPTPSKHVIPKKILHTYPSKHISAWSWSLVSNSYQWFLWGELSALRVYPMRFPSKGVMHPSALRVYPLRFHSDGVLHPQSLGEPRYKKTVKKGDIVPFRQTPPPKRVKRGHLLSEKRA